MTESAKNTFPFLLASLKESQDTVRSYDVKAQIVGVGYIFAMGFIVELGSQIANMPEWGVATIILAWLIVVLPVVLFGAVLYPSRRVSPKLGEKASDADRTFYVIPEYVQDVHSYLAAVEAGDPQKELAYEILKTAKLREIKRRRFLRALWAAAISFVALFLTQLLRAEDLLPF